MTKRVILKTIVFLILAAVIPEITILTWWEALLSVLLIGVLNVIVGWPLKLFTLPLSFITFGLFDLVINAIILTIVDALMSGVTLGNFATRIFIAAIFSITGALFLDKDD